MFLRTAGLEQNTLIIPDRVLHTQNPRTQRVRQDRPEFEANLGYIEKSCIKKSKENEIVYGLGRCTSYLVIAVIKIS